MSVFVVGQAAVGETNGRGTTTSATAATVAGGLRSAVIALESAGDERPGFGAWLEQRVRRADQVVASHMRDRAILPWVRLFGNGIDTVLGVLDPSGYLPRFELQTYRVLLVRPVNTEITSEFGYRDDPIRHRTRYHKGLDFHAPRGTPIHAAAPGIVRMARRWGTYGRIIVIDHGDGIETRYAHLSRYRVSEGDYVAANAIIGLSGASGRVTGPHLHFEVRQDGRAVDPAKAFVDSPAAPAESPTEPANMRELQRFHSGDTDMGISLKPGS